MSEDDKKGLESFKIGDKQGGPGISRPTASRRATEEPAEAGFSLGFARIETMLEKEDPVAVGQGLSDILGALEAFQAQATSNKDKLAAKKAIVAVERTVDLMDYLFETKAALETGAAG